jgi:hypothetical protein
VASWPVSTDRIPLGVIGTGANTRSKHIERSALSGSSRPPTLLAAGIGFRTEVPTFAPLAVVRSAPHLERPGFKSEMLREAVSP